MTQGMWSVLGTYLVGMIAITNPAGNLGIFLSLTGEYTPQQRRKTALTTTFAVAMIFIIVTWCGEWLLKLLGISLPAFEMGGGLVITLLGLSMLSTKTSPMAHTSDEHNAAINKPSIAVVPLAIPIIAGPGAITTILVNLQHVTTIGVKIGLCISNILVAGIIGLTLLFGGVINRVLGVAGVNIVTRVMGLILVAISMQLITDGLIKIFPALAT